MADRKPISAKTRYAVMGRDGFACQACGGKAPNVTLQVDHKIPVAKGGTDDLENLRTLCITCNLGKSDDVPVEKVEAPKEEDKHVLIGWGFLSYTTKDGKEVLQEQGLIRDVIYVSSEIGHAALVDYFEWFGGEYTNSRLVPLKEFSEPWGAPKFYKLFPSVQDRNEYYEWKHGR